MYLLREQVHESLYFTNRLLFPQKQFTMRVFICHPENKYLKRSERMLCFKESFIALCTLKYLEDMNILISNMENTAKIIMTKLDASPSAPRTLVH